MPTKRWQIYPHQPDLSQTIRQRLGCHPVIAQLLLNRNIKSLKSAQAFLNPTSEHFSDNFDAAAVTLAGKLIDDCLKTQAPILIYGDYDVDGITATAMLTDVLRQLGGRVDYVIPHRFNDGYGLNLKRAEQCITRGYRLLITLDCGSSNEKEIAYIKAHSDMAVIVMDHHQIPELVPPADVILNPKIFDETHTLYALAAVAVVYQFLTCFCVEFHKPLDLTNYLDLVAMGTVADVSSLTGINRYFVQKGLQLLTHKKRKGIAALYHMAGIHQEEVTARDIGFIIAPRLNAAGRLSDANICVELLLTQDDSVANRLAFQLQKMNEHRQQIERGIHESCLKKIKNDPALLEDKIVVLSDSDWHAGVIGITASKLCELTAKPVVLIAQESPFSRGSARAPQAVNIFDLLSRCSDFFEKFGGHKVAAGFSIQSERIAEFKQAVTTLAGSVITETMLQPILTIDCQLSPADITAEFIHHVTQLSPFGAGNPMPLFYTNELTPVDFKTVGSQNDHIKVTLTDKKGQLVFDAIGFGLSEKLPMLYHSHVELAFHVNMNTWNGRVLPQLQLVDLR